MVTKFAIDRRMIYKVITKFAIGYRMKDFDTDSMLYGTVTNIPPKERGNRGFFPSSKVDEGIVEYESQAYR